eukprot:5564776-Pyramimonas_sp.AAC.2
MGIMEDVNILPQPSEEPGQLDLTLNVVERKTGGFSAGGGLSARGVLEGSLSGFIGSMAYTQKNLFGLNHKLAASVEAGQPPNYIPPPFALLITPCMSHEAGAGVGRICHTRLGQ